MGTSSIVGTVDLASGAFRGRYVHFDGAPTTRVPVLADLLARTFHHDLAAMLHTLTEQHHGWSNITTCQQELSAAQDPERFRLVPGVGTAYCDTPSGKDWWTGTLTPPTQNYYAEWTYLFTGDDRSDAELIIAESTYIEQRPGLTVRGRIPVWELATVDHAALSALECGADYERCTHYAWFHFPEVPEESHMLSTAEWLGTEALTPRHAIEISVDGDRLIPAGSGHSHGEWWNISARPAGGGPAQTVRYLRIERDGGVTNTLAPGVEILRYPATAAQSRRR